MAVYNTGFPVGYQPYNMYQSMYTQPMQQPIQQPMQATAQQPQIQNGGFVSVPNIDVARNYPVAPGNSVTFKDESAPYIYTKTMSYNQLDAPRFERFRLVKEDEVPQTPVSTPNSDTVNTSGYALKTDLDALERVVGAFKDEMIDFRHRLDGISGKKPTRETEESEVD